VQLTQVGRALRDRRGLPGAGRWGRARLSDPGRLALPAPGSDLGTPTVPGEVTRVALRQKLRKRWRVRMTTTRDCSTGPGPPGAMTRPLPPRPRPLTDRPGAKAGRRAAARARTRPARSGTLVPDRLPGDGGPRSPDAPATLPRIASRAVSDGLLVPAARVPPRQRWLALRSLPESVPAVYLPDLLSLLSVALNPD
jgi:hypothetical protein